MTRTRIAAILVAFALLALVPLVVTDSYVRHLFIIAFIYAVVASNWDLSLGYTGLFNFGHLTFFGVGVYTAAILAETVELSPWAAILCGGITAALAALLISAPVARLKGIYVVLVTFAFSQLAMQVVLSQSDITGGAEGIVRIPYLQVGDYRFIRDYNLAYYYTAFAMLCVSTVFLLAVVASPFGKSLRALRDNPDYAASRGISVARQRIMSLVLSAVFTGIAGGFYAIYLRVASPEVFGFGTLSLALSMVLIGGVGTIIGPVLAALFLTFLTEAMAGIRGLEDARFIVVALAMILVLRLAPGGSIEMLSRLRLGAGFRSRRETTDTAGNRS
ncbi:branched-chain amino acid ABC transporter permease [Histidinibacterium aquaticum]|uniref:Branched-chain amino acid ABC transporter permease n=1 Tax=Histidinibacterium aquaticum TaxID=2613962 RepID=A0A5J5GRP7_9RHOB|nr:branched-chain amino acid ABC transporter permease [Histidinibacterium aquaticum]KAA9010343.1 branched-chain amino acid ABC transporter permease [Histidinibacterium aquaticum]